MTRSVFWHLWRQLRAWWRQPPLRDRLLVDLLVAGEPLAGLELKRRLALEWTSPYPALSRLVDEGLVERLSAPDLTVYSSDRALQRFRYRITDSGRAAALAMQIR